MPKNKFQGFIFGIIMSYAMMDFEEAKQFKPKVAFPDSENKILK